jgi:hypothetical protein
VPKPSVSAHVLDRLVAALADDVGCAEPSPEFDAVGTMAHENNALGAETSSGNDAAQADGAVADNCCRLARADVGAAGRVVAGRHHVRQGEQ